MAVGIIRKHSPIARNNPHTKNAMSFGEISKLKSGSVKAWIFKIGIITAAAPAAQNISAGALFKDGFGVKNANRPVTKNNIPKHITLA